MPVPFEQSISGADVSVGTNQDWSGAQYNLVDIDSNGLAIKHTSAGQRAVGVMQDKPNGSSYPGVAGSVRTAGVTKVVATGIIAAGADVGSNGDGTVKTAVANTVSSSNVIGSEVIGVALTASTATGDLISIILKPRGSVPSAPS